MVLMALPPADHLLIERERGQFVASRRRRMMANARAERLLKIPAEPSPELRIPGAAAQTRVVSMAGIRLDSRKSVRSFKGIICVDISEFESHMPSQAVGSLWRVYPVHALCEPHGGPNSSGRACGLLKVRDLITFHVIDMRHAIQHCRHVSRRVCRLQE